METFLHSFVLYVSCSKRMVVVEEIMYVLVIYAEEESVRGHLERWDLHACIVSIIVILQMVLS